MLFPREPIIMDCEYSSGDLNNRELQDDDARKDDDEPVARGQSSEDVELVMNLSGA